MVDGGAHAGFDGVGREAGTAVDAGFVAAFAAVAEFVEGDALAAVVFLESPSVAQDLDEDFEFGHGGDAQELVDEGVGEFAPVFVGKGEAGKGDVGLA
ncbi:MAG: hypothetical protein QM302_09815 [Acidobacteriota bacterium]|nr:hypothetical protein [Acidobacteriota bacterium]